MGKGRGKGAAQLGKAIKGKSKERSKLLNAQQQRNGANDDLLNGNEDINNDVGLLEEYERLSKLSEAHRQRMRSSAASLGGITAANERIVRAMKRAEARSEKVDSLRKEVELLAHNHTRDVIRKDAVIQQLLQDLNHTEEQSDRVTAPFDSFPNAYFLHLILCFLYCDQTPKC